MKSWIFQLLRPFKTSLAKILVIQLCMAVIIAIQPIYMQQLVGVMLEGALLGTLLAVAILVSGAGGEFIYFQF